jgi:putative transposase
LTTEQKRELVTIFHDQEGHPITSLCCLLDLPRSSCYYRPLERKENELRQAIEAVASEFATYGSRRVTQELRRPPYEMRINRKRTQRLMREMGLQRSQKRRKRRTTDSQHGFPRYPNLLTDLEVTYPDQVWVSDITYIRLLRQFIYLAVIMDVFTRSIRGWHLSRWLDQSLTLTALQRALRAHVPQIHHSDQGIQYAANAYVDLLLESHVQISMAARGAPEENPYAERLIRTIKEEEVDLSEYQDFADARSQIGHFIEQVYQKKRIHSSLGYLTPVEFEDTYWQVQPEQMSSLSIA